MTAPATLEADRLSVLTAALGATRVGEMLAMLRAELVLLADAATGPDRLGDAEHVHPLKGAAAMLGAASLAAALARLEAAPEDGTARTTAIAAVRATIAAIDTA